jgi:hypothetical protein
MGIALWCMHRSMIPELYCALNAKEEDSGLAWAKQRFDKCCMFWCAEGATNKSRFGAEARGNT